MGNKTNTTVVLIIIGILLLLLWLKFPSPVGEKLSTYDFACLDFTNIGQNLGASSNSWINATAQKVTVNDTLLVQQISIRFGYRYGDPAALGPWTVGVANAYNGPFIWSTTFNPNIVSIENSNVLYNVTVPRISVHSFTYIRIEYAGTHVSVGRADYLETRIGYTKLQTDEGVWWLTSSHGWENGGSMILNCGVAG